MCVFLSRSPFFFFLISVQQLEIKSVFQPPKLQHENQIDRRVNLDITLRALFMISLLFLHGHFKVITRRLRRHRVAQLFIFHQRPFEVRKRQKKINHNTVINTFLTADRMTFDPKLAR